MKKTLFTCLVLTLAALSLFVSCNPETKAKVEDVAYIRFGENTRAFSADYEAEKYSDLYWFYEATKNDNYGTTGATTVVTGIPVESTGKAVPVNETTGTPSKGLDISGYLGPFSQGDWSFNLYAYKCSEETYSANNLTLIYSAKNIEYTLKGGESRSIPVTVNPEGKTGIVEFDNAYFEYKTSGTAAPGLELTAESAGAYDDGRKKTYIFSTMGNTSNAENFYQIKLTSSDMKKYYVSFDNASTTQAILAVGYNGEETYKCTVKVTIPNGTDSFTELTDTFYFGVYSGGAVTTISGDLVEDPSAYWKFDVAEYTLKTVDTTTLTSEDGVTVGNAKLKFSSDDLDDASATYTLKVAETSKTKLADSFIVSDGSDVSAVQKVYSFSLVNTKTNEEVTNFESGKVTAELNVGTGLNNGKDYNIGGSTNSSETCSIEAKYNGNGSDATVKSYNTTSGVLTMETNHFSEFVIIDTAKLPVSVTEDNSTVYYSSLADAFKAAGDGATIKVIHSESGNPVKLTKVIETTVNLTFDLNSKEIDADGNYIVVGQGKTLKVQNGVDDQANFVVGVGGDSGIYSSAVAKAVSDSTVTYYADIKTALEDTKVSSITLLADTSWTGTAPIAVKRSLILDLNGKKLELKNTTGTSCDNDYNNTSARAIVLNSADAAYTVTIKNGKLAGSVYGNIFTVNSNTGLALEKVYMDVTCARAIQIVDYTQNGAVDIRGCTLDVKGWYAVATNASTDKEVSKGNTISINNSTITVENNNGDCTGLLLNVPGTYSVTKSSVTGGRQGAILRGGTFDISDSTFAYTTNYSENKNKESTSWGNGNAVPNATIVIGNRGGAYAYPTTVTLSGTNTLTVPTETMDNKTNYNLYIYQGDDSYPVTVDANENETWNINEEMNGAYCSWLNGKYQARIGKNSYYTNLQGAIDVASSDATIEVLKDVELEDESCITIDKSITLNGNDHKIYKINHSETLPLIQIGNYGGVANPRKIVLEDLDVEITGSTTSGQDSAVRLINIWNIGRTGETSHDTDSSVTFTNVKMKIAENGTLSYIRGLSTDNIHCKITLDSCTVELPNYYAVYIGSNCDNAVLNIKNGSKIKGWATVYNFGSSNFTVDAENSTFESVNHLQNGGKPNSFASVIVSEVKKSNNKMRFENCVLSAVKTYPEADVTQKIADIRSNGPNEVSFTNCTLTPAAGSKYFRITWDPTGSDSSSYTSTTNELCVDNVDIIQTQDERIEWNPVLK